MSAAVVPDAKLIVSDPWFPRTCMVVAAPSVPLAPAKTALTCATSDPCITLMLTLEYEPGGIFAEFTCTLAR